MSSLILILFTLICLVMVVKFMIYPYYVHGPVGYVDDEVHTYTTTTTTTTTTEDPWIVEGEIKRFQDNETKQYYVMDPHSKQKFYVNDSDDMYRDDAGKIWRLI